MTQSPSSSKKTADTLFEPLQTARTSERVAEAIRRIIVRGKLRPGENLPPERTLARSFQVTRNTVREALRKLEQLRLVSIRQGSGITVQDYLTTAGLEFVVDMLGHSEDGADLMQELAEAREVIGRAMVFHAMDHLEPHALVSVGQAVQDFVAESRSDEPDVGRLQDLDFEIHSRLVRAGGNRAIILLHNSLRHVYRHVAHLFEPLVAEPRRLADRYERILEALRVGDREAARDEFSRYFALGLEDLGGAGVPPTRAPKERDQR